MPHRRYARGPPEPRPLGQFHDAALQMAHLSSLVLPPPLAAPAEHLEDGDELLRHALGVVRRHFGMAAAFIAEFRDGRLHLRYVDASPEGGGPGVREGDSRALDETYCQRMLDGRLPSVIPDTAAVPAAAALGVTRQLPIGSYLGVPMRFHDGTVYGSLCCLDSIPQELGERDAETLRAFADFLAGLLDRRPGRQAGVRKQVERVQRVLQEEAFNIAYQPIVDVTTREVAGYEALARFTALPPRTPDLWLAEAAAAGLQAELELCIVRKALRALPRVPGHAYLSINISPGTILADGFDAAFEGWPLHRVVLEVTEHACIDDYGMLAQRLQPLRAAGLRLAVDDAGAGFASFRHILQIRPDDIKLDISLIRRVDRDLGARALAAALIRFAQETGSHIVAEGVETESVLQVLRELGVDKAQGYLLGHPGPLP